MMIYPFQVPTNLVTRQFISDNGKMVKEKVQVDNIGKMDLTIMDIGKIAWLMEKVD